MAVSTHCRSSRLSTSRTPSPPEDLDAQVGVVDALGVVEGAVLGELREAPDIVKQGDHLGDLLLAVVESQSLGQFEDLFAGAPGVLLLHLQVRVDALIRAEEAARVRIEPSPEVVQRIGFHSIYYLLFVIYSL